MTSCFLVLIWQGVGGAILEYTHFYLSDINSKKLYYVKHGKKIINYESFEKFLDLILE